MKNVQLIVLLALLLLLPACAPRLSQSKTDEWGALTEAQRIVISDAQSAFCIINELPLWDTALGNQKTIASLAIGEKVELTGKTVKPAGKRAHLMQVIAKSRVTGWVQSDSVVPNSILAVVVYERVSVYERPADSAWTERSLPYMTILAIHVDSAASKYVRVTYYDAGTGSLNKEVFLRNDGLSSRPENVESAILYIMASRSKNAKQKAAFLGSALADYPGSAFAALITNALEALNAPKPAEAALTDPFVATLTVDADAVNVLSFPDGTAADVVSTLAKGQRVRTIEKTRVDGSIGSLSAPWYRIENPAGWIFGAFLLEE